MDFKFSKYRGKLRTYYIIALLLLILFSSCSTKYYIVRHAEKLNNTDTSSLSPEGLLRAEALKNYLISKDIKKIYASVYKRTQQTAKPLADATGEEVIIYSPDTTQAFANHLKKLSGTNVLVVGHTNTIPEIVEILSDDSISPIAENDFDNMYIVEVDKNLGWVSRYLNSVTYGALSP